MKGATLVVLAAGMGSRYGGLKQMDALGRGGETLLDYSVFDAARSGFDRAVFIVRRDIEEDFRKTVLARMEGRVRCDLAFQELDSLIPPDLFARARAAGRTKPWGTTHALLCAADLIDGPFAVINADDFYGRGAFAALGAHLLGPDSGTPAIVPYRLGGTLSPRGSVARGVCSVDGGFLSSVEELSSIEMREGRIVSAAPDGTERVLDADSPVSMNFWGFPAGIMPAFATCFDRFLEGVSADVAGSLKSECYIPGAVDDFIKKGAARVRVIEADSRWFGMTYREDRDEVARALAELTEVGEYPERLWG